jgi:uncharacterized membrane protein YfcA
MAPVGFALSILIGVSLGFFGGGGSILTVPLLVYVFGLDPKQAIASSLLIVGAASLSGAIQHWRAGNIELRTSLYFGAAGMVGAHLGGRAGAYLDGTLLLLLFAAMMMITATAMWRGRRVPKGATVGERSLGPLIAQGFGVGLFTGLVGAGGGFLIVPALALWAGLPMPAAIGTSLVIIVLNSLAGFSGYVGHVSVSYGLIGGIAACAIAGSFIGTRLTRRVDPASLRRAFAGFVLAMAVLILVREVDVWLETVRSVVPSSIPQIVFALVVLAIGIATGRVSRRSATTPISETAFEGGAGI